MTQPNMMQRLIRYCQGLFGVKMNQTEIGRTDIVYHNAIRDRVKQHHDLKTALSRLIILRNRADARGLSFQEDLGVVEAALQSLGLERVRSLFVITLKVQIIIRSWFVVTLKLQRPFL